MRTYIGAVDNSKSTIDIMKSIFKAKDKSKRVSAGVMDA